MFEVVEAKLKQVVEPWHKYLDGKKLLVCTSIGGHWNLCAIEGEEGLKAFCKHVWDNQDEHEYDSLEDFQEDVADGNYGFTLLKDEVELEKMVACTELM